MRQIGLPGVPKPDYAPSKWAWRIERLRLTPGVLLGLRVGVPIVCLIAALAGWLSFEGNRRAITDELRNLSVVMKNRPEFMVQMMIIDGADPQVAHAIRDMMPLNFPVSSFNLDLDGLRAKISALTPVAHATLRVRPGGVLAINITQRTPAALWRQTDGLFVIDESGVIIAPANQRDAHPTLPVLAGEGAHTYVREGLALISRARDLGRRVQGLVRIGNRRWDVVLSKGQRILLPQHDAEQALERVIALEAARGLLSRDISRIDMRLSARPTVRMGTHAQTQWRRIKKIEQGAS